MINQEENVQQADKAVKTCLNVWDSICNSKLVSKALPLTTLAVTVALIPIPTDTIDNLGDVIAIWQ